VGADGTHRILFEPLAFLAKLAALVPPPLEHLVTLHCVLAPASAIRAEVVPAARATRALAGKRLARSCGRHPWAELLRRAFAVDVLRCPQSVERASARAWSGVVVAAFRRARRPRLPCPYARRRELG
jgi:hypothetical protein